jgi:hypothetical protein
MSTLQGTAITVGSQDGQLPSAADPPDSGW